MEKDDDEQRRQADEQIERELRQGRKFTAREAMARMAGPGAMKGASPVSPVQQAETEIGTWLRHHVTDPDGALKVVLHRQIKGSKGLLDSIDKPLAAVAAHCRHILTSDYLLKELVRQADVEWGRTMGERPFFDREDAPPNPDDPYTARSVAAALAEIVEQLSAASDQVGRPDRGEA